VLTGCDVLFGLSAVGIREHSVQFILAKMSFYGSAGPRAGTLSSELTGGTGSSGSRVLIMVALFIVMPPFQDLARRTGKGVGGSVKASFGKIPLFLPEPRCVASKEGIWALIPKSWQMR